MLVKGATGGGSSADHEMQTTSGVSLCGVVVEVCDLLTPGQMGETWRQVNSPHGDWLDRDPPCWPSTARSMIGREEWLWKWRIHNWINCAWKNICRKKGIKLLMYVGDIRTDSKIAPSQWETSLQSNAVSHWLGASLESALDIKCVFTVQLFMSPKTTRTNVVVVWYLPTVQI